MPPLFASSRKVEVYRFGLPATVLVPLFALVLQTYLPFYLTLATLLDLPLLVILYFSLTRHSPVSSMLGGALIGLAQDSMTQGPIGLFGTVKTVVGYVTTSVSIRFDTENTVVRFLTVFVFYYLHFFLLFLLASVLLQLPFELDWRGRLFAALVNALVGVLLFHLLDRFRKPA